MAGHAVLILESDPAIERQINDILSSAGYDVYAAEGVDPVLRALDATRFPIVVIDAGAPGLAITAFVDAALQRQPDCMIIFTSSHITTADAITMMRVGAADLLHKPVDPAVLLTSAASALDRREARRARVRTLETRLRAAEAALEEVRTGSGISQLKLVRLRDFAEFALERFLEIEKRTVEMSRRLQAFEAPDAATTRAPVKTWVVHTDAEFAAGVASLGPKIGLEIGPPMSTGGEVLDKIGNELPQIVIMDGTLPDIPATLVLDTVISEYPEIQVVVVDGWGTPVRHVSLHSGTAPVQQVAMETVRQLIDMLETAAAHAVEVTAGREIASQFRQRHEDFLRKVGELRTALDG